MQHQQTDLLSPMLKWLTDRQAALENPRRVLLALFIIGVVGGGAIGYFRIADRDLVKASVVGVGFGVIIVFAEVRYRRDPAAATEKAARSHTFEVVVGAIGLALLVVGALTASVRVALSGLPFCGLALVMFGARKAISRNL